MPYADPKRKRESDRAYKAARRDELAAKQRAYYRRTRPARYAAVAAYNRRHPEMVKRIKYANRANTRAASFGSTEKLYARDLPNLTGSCSYCEREAVTWDHVVPLSRGGANSVENLVPCCEPCNRSKGRKLVSEWRL